MLDCQHLAIILEVDRLGSVTAAAERLNVTQSALSHTIRKVEERYGVKIWVRDGRSLRYTQAGEYLLALAQRLIPQIDDAERVLKDFAKGRRGILRVGMECHPCQRWLARLTPHYLAGWPDVDFDVRTGFRFDGVAALLDYEIDALITPDPIELRELLFVPVIDYKLVLVVHEAHRLAGRDYVEAHDLVDEELITVPVGIERLDIFTRFLVPANCRPKGHRTAETTDLLLQLVAAGRGVSALPDWLVLDEGGELPIRALPLGRKGLSKSINVGTRRGENQISYIAGFVQLAQEMGASIDRNADQQRAPGFLSGS